MKTRDIYLLVATVIVATGCRGNSGDALHRGQQQYEVVQEGAASGVSSTINGPGELTAPAMTGTNADTTTDFNLPTTLPPASAAQQQPGMIAGSLPPAYNGGGYTGEAPRTPPRPVAQQPSAPRPAAQPSYPQQSQPAYQPPQQAAQPAQPAQPQPSEPAAEPAPAPGPSDTAEPAEPQQPPAHQSQPAQPQEKKQKPADEPKDEPPATDTAPSEPPAPPPQR